MRKRYLLSTACALALGTSLVVQAQQVPPVGQAPAGGAQAANPEAQRKVVVTGENPAIRKLDKEGGAAVTNADFFRVTWSPAGAGSICAIRVQNQPNPADNINIAIYDDQATFDYMVKEIRTDYGKYTPMKGTITQTNTVTTADGFTRKETCRTDKYTVELIWKNLQQASFSDRPMAGVQMAMVMVPALGGEITINGRSAPGTWYPRGGGMGTGAYLMLGETWRRNNAN